MKNKEIITYSILLSVILLGGYLTYNLIGKPTSNTINSDKVTTLDTASPVDVEELQLTEEQLKQYYATYNDPFVMHVRYALNNYLVGSIDGVSESVIKSEKSDDGTVSGLDSFNKSYYESKFTVFAINDGLMGGKVINIIFQDNPDKLFNAWVYQITDESYELRGFWQNMSFDVNEMKKIQKQHKTYLNDSEHAL